MKHEETRLFEGAESFEQPLTGIVFDRALMDAASPYKDEAMYPRCGPSQSATCCVRSEHHSLCACSLQRR
jgi:hypothetical protein